MYIGSTLPEYRMVAGETKKLTIPLYTSSKKQIDATGMKARLAVSDFVNRGGAPFLIKECSITPASADISGMLHVELEPQDTLELAGKFIYQVTAKSPDDDFGVMRGVLWIDANTDKGAITM